MTYLFLFSKIRNDGTQNEVLLDNYRKRVRPCIDLIDKLRALGIDQDVPLPTIAVVGDQSAGKSSVLEAISGVQLPRGTGKQLMKRFLIACTKCTMSNMYNAFCNIIPVSVKFCYINYIYNSRFGFHFYSYLQVHGAPCQHSASFFISLKVIP